MVAEKITDLTAQTAAGAASGDLVPNVDISDTSMAGTGTDKSLTIANLGTAHLLVAGAAVAGDTFMYDGSSQAVAKTIRSQYDAGVAVTTTGLQTMMSSTFTIKSPLTVGDRFDLILGATLNNASGGALAPRIQVTLGGSAIADFTAASGDAANSFTTHYLMHVLFVVTVVNASTGSVGVVAYEHGGGNTARGSFQNASAAVYAGTTGSLNTSADIVLDCKVNTTTSTSTTWTPTIISLLRTPKV